MYYLIDTKTGKYLTLYGPKVISFTDNTKIAKAFKNVDDAYDFIEFYSNEFDEYVKPKFI